MDVRLRRLLYRQAGVIAVWQLERMGFSAEWVRHFVRGLRRLHDGVWLTGFAPITREQRWWGAALSAEGTLLGGRSAGAAWGFRPWQAAREVVLRAGSGGPRRIDGLIVCRSSVILDADRRRLGHLPLTSPERTILDLAAAQSPRTTRKCVREAVRLRLTTMDGLAGPLARTPGRRGTADLRRYLAHHSTLPFHRCRSDAEAMALEVLHAARVPAPGVNERIAGEEADLSWPDRRVIVEIDGPDFHRFKAEDARKTAIWRPAGWDVRRVPSTTVFDDPAAFVAQL
jgi:hypothetical protein